MPAMPANQLRSRSSQPKSVQGRTIVASGNSSSTAASPAAFVRAHSDGLLASAAMALTCTKPAAPAALACRAIARAASTLTSS